MDMHDWNGDGNDDLTDDFLEYSIFNEVNNDHNNYSPPPRGCGETAIRVIISLIAGLIIPAVISTALGIEVDDVPAFVIMLFWMVTSTVVAVLLELFA